MRLMTVAGAALAMLATAPKIAVADVLADCSRSRDAAIRLKACTDIIAGANFSREQKAVAFRGRGSVRSDAGATEQAIADYSDAIRLDERDASAYAGRAQVLFTRNDLDASIADFTAALRLVPASAGSVSFLVGRGHAQLVKGLFEPAIADFNEAIRINPKSATAFNNRGLAYRGKGDLDRAIDDYTAAISLNPVYALAYNNRGYVYEAKGRADDAVADFQRALLLDRSLTGATAGLKRLKATGPLADESDRLIKDGQSLVESNCSRCHAVGPVGPSPNTKAPEFRNLGQKHPVLALREPLSRGIAAQHDEMPRFAFTDMDLDKIIAYINNLNATGRK